MGHNMNDDEIANFVILRQAPVRADLLIVLGSANVNELQQRVSRCAELFHAGFAQRLLLSGGTTPSHPLSEASRMSQQLAELRVPPAAMQLEDQSTNTFENASYCLKLLAKTGQLKNLSTVILVSSEWHMRRSLLTFQCFFPRSVQFVCCPTETGCTRENWTRSEACRKQVSHEARLLMNFLDAGLIGT